MWIQYLLIVEQQRSNVPFNCLISFYQTIQPKNNSCKYSLSPHSALSISSLDFFILFDYFINTKQQSATILIKTDWLRLDYYYILKLFNLSLLLQNDVFDIAERDCRPPERLRRRPSFFLESFRPAGVQRRQWRLQLLYCYVCIIELMDLAKKYLF